MLSKIKYRLGIKPNYFRDSKQVVEYAFTCGGIDYYQHVDEMNMPWKRFLNAITFLTELDSKIDRQYLELHTRAVDTIFSKSKLAFSDLAQLKSLNDKMKERMAMVVIADHVYKVASVRFFDRNENPNDFDFKYAEQKIAHWKKHEDVNAFFLREPVQKLIPLLKSAQVNFVQYSAMLDELLKAQSSSILEILPPQERQGLRSSIDKLFWEATRHQKPA